MVGPVVHLKEGRMHMNIGFDPAIESELVQVQLIIDTLRRRRAPHDNARENPPGTSDLPAKAADDLLGRLGKGGRALFEITSEFDEPFSLPDLARRTGDTISRIKSRWANLGRSIAQTRSRFGAVEIFKEHLPAPD